MIVSAISYSFSLFVCRCCYCVGLDYGIGSVLVKKYLRIIRCKKKGCLSDMQIRTHLAENKDECKKKFTLRVLFKWIVYLHNTLFVCLVSVCVPRHHREKRKKDLACECVCFFTYINRIGMKGRKKVESIVVGFSHFKWNESLINKVGTRAKSVILPVLFDYQIKYCVLLLRYGFSLIWCCLWWSNVKTLTFG